MNTNRSAVQAAGGISGAVNSKSPSPWPDDPVACLRGLGSSVLRLKKREAVFYQAMAADCVFYLLKGRVKLTAVSTEGKEATVALMSAGDFLGEECIVEHQTIRTTTAMAISDCIVMRVERKAMIDALRREASFFNFFLSFVVSRNVRMQDDLMDRFFNTGEKRLARVLLSMAGLNGAGEQEMEVPKVSQETLAEIVGTTRSRINIFMNSFRKQGLISYDGDYSGSLIVRSTLRQVLTRE
ncbi:MAG TPA: Crp/Fnr family transcriptional regulator [Candidatus Angelobacter sp.]|nr:Crp/Fnr family transcriptional regulator [Candidatus Angelobacter sp.]